MRTPTLPEILFAVAGIAIGWGVGATPSAHALQETAAPVRLKHFKVIDHKDAETIEAALDLAVSTNHTCKLVAAVAVNDGFTKVILECLY